jgi:hypothetical protein
MSFSNSASFNLLLVMTISAWPVPAQNQTPANVPPPAAWKDVWKGPNTRLTWALKDNGSAITQPQALDYCRNLRLAGFGDWRPPERGELSGLYDESVTQRIPAPGFDNNYLIVHVKGGIQLTSDLAWSATPENVFNFTNGTWFLNVRGGSIMRALCVRSAGE